MFRRRSCVFLRGSCVVSATSETLVLWCLWPASGLLVAYKSLGGFPVPSWGGWGGWAAAGAVTHWPPMLPAAAARPSDLP